MREQNLKLTKRGYDLFSKGDVETLRLELFTEDAIWKTAATEVFEPEYKGIDAIVGYWMKLFEMTGGTFKVTPVHILADDERSVAIQHISGSREGKILESEIALVFHVRDGKVYEVTEYASEPASLQAFWS